MDEEKKENAKKYFKSKRFALTLLCSLVAVIIGSAVAVGVARNMTDKIELEYYSRTTRPTTNKNENVTQGAAADVTGIPDTRNAEDETTSRKSVPEEKFIFPISNNILKDYSNGAAVKSETLGDWRVHSGIDFSAETGDRVKAVKSGSVLSVYMNDLWGTVVEIDHGDGIVAKYCGLKDGTTPKKGDTLEQGETVGTVSSIPSEAAEPPHLHFEISLNGSTVDPLEAMGMTE